MRTHQWIILVYDAVNFLHISILYYGKSFPMNDSSDLTRHLNDVSIYQFVITFLAKLIVNLIKLWQYTLNKGERSQHFY